MTRWVLIKMTQLIRNTWEVISIPDRILIGSLILLSIGILVRAYFKTK